MQPRNKNLIVLGILAFGIFMRILPYVLKELGAVSLIDISSYIWNISPVPAMFLLGGAYFSNRWGGLAVGLLAYLTSDMLIGLISGQPAFSFYNTLPFVYAGLLLHGVMGLTLRQKNAIGRMILVAISSEVLFFLLTNTGEWAIGDMNYEKSFRGLLASYAAGLPFLQRSIFGTPIYAVIFFSLAKMLEKPEPTLVKVPATATDGCA